MKLTTVATANRVWIVGEDGTAIALTPDLADEVARELPEKAIQARALSDIEDDPLAAAAGIARLVNRRGAVKH